MKKTSFLLLPLLFAASTAIAALPLIVTPFLLQSINLHLAVGNVIWFFTRDVRATPTSPPVRLFLEVVDEATPDDPGVYPGPDGVSLPTPPQTVSRASTGGRMSVAFPTTASNGYTSTGWTQFDGNPAQFIETLRYLPTPPYNYRAIGEYFSGANRTLWSVEQKYTKTPLAMFTSRYCQVGGCSPETATLSNTHYVELSNDKTVIRFRMLDASFTNCPAGYSVNESDESTCHLTDAEQVLKSGTLRDGKCFVTVDGPNPFDPDCASIQGAFSRERKEDGTPVLVIKDPSGSTPETIAISRNKDNSKQISVAKRGQNGEGVLQTAKVTPDGKVGEVSGTNYPGSPAPQYPGQTGEGDIDAGGGGSPGGGGTGAPGGSSTHVGAGCGGRNQDKCAVETGDPTGKVPDSIPDSLKNAFSGLQGKTVSASSQCPVDMFSLNLPLPATAGGPMLVSDYGAFCNAMSQYQDLFRMVSIAASFIAATFIVLRA